MNLLREIFTQNLGLKFIALVVSIALFVVLRAAQDDRRTVSVLVVQPERSGRILVSDIPDEIRVTLRGSRVALNTVVRDGIPALQIPTDHSASFYYIEQDKIEVPPGVTIEQVTPGTLQLRWTERGQARRPIAALIEGELPAGLVRGEVQVHPTHVRIHGAAGEVDRIEAIRTRVVSVDGLTAGRHPFRVPLMPLPGHVSYEGSGDATVTVVVEEEEGRRRFEELDIAVVGGTGYALRPSVVRVDITGPRAVVEELDPTRVVPFVDVSGVAPTQGAQPLPLEVRPLPDGIEVQIEPPEVLVVPVR